MITQNSKVVDDSGLEDNVLIIHDVILQSESKKWVSERSTKLFQNTSRLLGIRKVHTSTHLFSQALDPKSVMSWDTSFTSGLRFQPSHSAFSYESKYGSLISLCDFPCSPQVTVSLRLGLAITYLANRIDMWNLIGEKEELG